MLAVIAALVVGLVAGAAGWQAARTDATAATTKLAQKYVAAGMWTSGQAAMFASNGKWVVVPENGVYGYGHAGTVVPKAILHDPKYYGTIEASMAAHDHYTVTWTGKERLAFAGPNGFVTEWTMKGYSSFTHKNFTGPGVSVSTVTNGKITLQKVYFDPTVVYGPAGVPKP